jgi:dihydrolipoamide dehydrogenase
MKRFDVLVIGSGSGMHIVENALASGMNVALVENGPLGGTCLNRGCIPSKIIIYPADIINLIRNAEKLGIKARIEHIDFGQIMKRMRYLVERDRSQMQRSVEQTKDLAFYHETGEFVSDYTMRVESGETFTAENIFIVSGARSLIPPVKGLDGVDYLTSENVWAIDEAPESVIIVGGGFVAVEFAHFFSTMGSEVTVVSRSPRLLKESEPEISELLEQSMRRRMRVETGFEVVEVSMRGETKDVVAANPRTGERIQASAKSLMIAAGRRSNADLLKPEMTGVKLDERGYVRVNEFLETSKGRIWAFGDAIGKAMFKHVANYEAGIAWHNFTHRHKAPMDYSAVPYAVFGDPQIASVGLTEREARERGLRVLVGRADYSDTAKGDAMGVEEGFCKVIVEEGSDRVLGGHVVGAYAPELLQEVIDIMNCEKGSYVPAIRAMHIHPALSEVVQNAFGNLHRHE